MYDIIGIGIGPFNLGMAALADEIDNLQCAFIDKEPEFNWHPGMMIPGTSLQVPFYADLVTIVNPQSKYSYLNYLKDRKRLFRFAIHENNFISRIEYNDYCQWVAGQLSSLHFGYACNAIYYDGPSQSYVVSITDTRNGHIDMMRCKHLVIGVGTIPHIPECAVGVKHPLVFHSANYLKNKDNLSDDLSVSIIGSGQSAAEVFYDLITNGSENMKIKWLTRSERFFPMEYSKLSLEMTSPDYIDHFYGLTDEQKSMTISKQDMLFKGINFSLINAIYDRLYEKQFKPGGIQPALYTNCELHAVKVTDDRIKLGFLHTELEESFSMYTDAVILATGYRNHLPFVIESEEGVLKWDYKNKFTIKRNYSINANEDIFVQNMDLHSHGFTSPDLGMGPYRNATILNTILGYEYFEMESSIAFQTFGVSRD